MNRGKALVLLVVSSISLAAIPGCHKDESPFSPTDPTAHPSAVDQRLVGSWYEVGSQEGIELTGDGTWVSLYVFQNRLAPGYYDRDVVGSFDTPQEGVIVHTWTDAFGHSQSKAFSYIFTDEGSRLVLNPVESESREGLTFVRTAIGDLVIRR